MKNGILVFRDQDHYNNYFDFLDMAIDSLDAKDTLSDINSVLQDIEDGLGFTSIRKTSHAAYEIQNQIGWSSLGAIPDEHFILAPDIRSTLNTALDVQIGDEIMHYVSKDFAVKVDINEKTLLEQFKTLPSDVSFSDITKIDPLRYHSSIIELTGSGRIFEIQRPTGINTIASPYITFPDKCHNPGYAKFENTSYYEDGSAVPAYFRIDFGDGSPVLPTSSFGNYSMGSYFVPAFYHTYAVPSSGSITYTMTIKACTNSSFAPAQTTTKQVPVPVSSSVGCATEFKESGWQFYNVPGTNRHIGGNLVMENVGGGKFRVVAYSNLVKLESGSYKSAKGELYVELTCDERMSQGCAFYNQMDGSGWDSNDNNQTLHRTSHVGTAWSLAKSKHGYKHNGTWYWKDITLLPCN